MKQRKNKRINLKNGIYFQKEKKCWGNCLDLAPLSPKDLCLTFLSLLIPSIQNGCLNIFMIILKNLTMLAS